MKSIGILTAAAIASGGVAWLALADRAPAAERAASTARTSTCRAHEPAAAYRVTFESRWSEQTHPEAFPRRAHYSGLHGATHHPGWRMWQVGGTASPGIEAMAERGKSSPLKDEIAAAMRAGDVGMQIRGDDLRRTPGSLSVDFQATREFPLVSLVAMLAPSPDWFIGIAALDLCEGGRWLMARTVELDVYDAGTDSGRSYEAPDADTQPRERITRIDAPPFRVEGQRRSVGKLTFEKR